MSGMLQRAELIEKADRLGIPWTNESSDAEIFALIQAREKGAMAATVEAMDPPCFGLMWDAVKEEGCQGCGAQTRCLEKFATATLPETITRLGKNPGLAVLAEELRVSPDAITVALEKNGAPKVARLQAVPPPQPVAPAPVQDAVPSEPAPVAAPEQPVAEAGDAVKKSGKKEAAAAKKAEAEAAKAAKEAEKKAKAEAKEKAAEEKRAAKEAEKAKKQAEKEAAAKAAEPTENPSVAAPASPAGVAAEARKAKRAGPVAVRADRRLEHPWGEHTFQSRWQRERERTPEIAALKTGQVLTVPFDGKEHQVTVLKEGYQYDGNRFPTLYSIVKEITGTVERQKQLIEGKRPQGTRQLCNWSAVRFFRLRNKGAAKVARVQMTKPGKQSPKKKPVKSAKRKAPGKPGQVHPQMRAREAKAPKRKASSKKK